MAGGKRNNYVLYGLLGFVALGLVGFGAQNFGGNVRSIGTVGSKVITAVDYRLAVAQTMDDVSRQIGQPITFQFAQSYGLDQSILAELVSNRSLDSEAAGLGLSVGDGRVRDSVVGNPEFAGIDGAFDPEAYGQTLAQLGQSKADYEAAVRDTLTRALLVNAVGSGIPGPEVSANTQLTYLGEQRSLTWARLDPGALTAPLPAPTEAELQAHYEGNPAAYTLPEVRQISYAWLNPDMIAGTVTVAEADLQQLYQDRLADYVKPERRLVERLVFLDDAAAAAARLRLDTAEVDFDALVAERGLALSDIDLGDVVLADLDAAGDAVFAAAPGDVVGPLASPLGPALFRINAVLAAEAVTLDQATPELRAELAAARARRVIEDQIENINNMLAGGATIADLAATTDMEAGQIAWTDTTSDGIAAYEDFRTTAAALQVGAFAELATLQDGGIYVAQLDSITPPTVQPLAAVQDAVLTGWTAAATQAAVLAEADRIATAISGGADFAAFGLTPTVSPDLTRRDFVEATPPGFSAAVFAMPAATAQVIDGGDHAIVVRLDSIAPADLTTEAALAEFEQLNAEAAQGIAQDLLTAFAGAVQESTEVTIDEAAVAAVNARFQ